MNMPSQHTSGSKIANALLSCYERFQLMEHKNLFFTALIAAFCLFSAGGIYLSQRSERSAFASYEASRCIEILLSTNFVQDGGSDAGRGGLKGGKSESLPLLLKKLDQFSQTSSDAASKASGILAIGFEATNNTTDSAEIDRSCQYLQQVKLPQWSAAVKTLCATAHSGAIAESRGSRYEDVLKLYQTLLSDTISSEEKERTARAFFQKYPNLQQTLETIWKQKIDYFYENFKK